MGIKEGLHMKYLLRYNPGHKQLAVVLNFMILYHVIKYPSSS